MSSSVGRVSIGATIVGVAALLLSAPVLAINVRTLREWVATQARVVSTTPFLLDPSGSEVWRPLIEYTDTAGVVHLSYSVLGSEPPSSYRVGSTLRIYFHADSPEQAAVAEYAIDWAMPAFGCLVGVLLLALAVRHAVREREPAVRVTSPTPPIRERAPTASVPSPMPPFPVRFLSLVLGTFVPFVSVIRPGNTTLAGTFVGFLAWATGFAISRRTFERGVHRAPPDPLFEVSSFATLVHLCMLRGLIRPMSLWAIALGCLAVWIGVRRLAHRGALTIREALGVLGIVGAVAGLQTAAGHILAWDNGARGFPPPWHMITVLLVFVASDRLCAGTAQPVAEAMAAPLLEARTRRA